MDGAQSIGAGTQLAVQSFLFREARLLDERRFDEWVDLFDPEGRYWVPMAWQQPNPEEHVSLFWEDVELLRLRAKRLQHKRTTSQWPPSRTCHQVGNIEIERAANGEVWTRSSLACAEYRRNEQRIFMGFVRHHLLAQSDTFRIKLKRVDLLNCDADIGHLRLAVPF